MSNELEQIKEVLASPDVPDNARKAMFALLNVLQGKEQELVKLRDENKILRVKAGLPAEEAPPPPPPPVVAKTKPQPVVAKQPVREELPKPVKSPPVQEKPPVPQADKQQEPPAPVKIDFGDIPVGVGNILEEFKLSRKKEIVLPPDEPVKKEVPKTKVFTADEIRRKNEELRENKSRPKFDPFADNTKKTEDVVEDKDAVYDIEQECPYCGYKPFVAYKLKSKTQRMHLDKFLVARYEGIKGYPDSDFLLLGVTVCPSCLFASEKDTDFISLSRSAMAKKPNLPASVLKEAMMNDKESRIAILKQFRVGPENFKRPRDRKTALVTYLLAIECGKVKVYNRKPHALPELGTYLLHAAAIAEEIGSKDFALELRKESIPYFERAYAMSDFPPEHDYEVAYLNIFLNLFTDEKAKAYSYVNSVDRKRRELHHKGGDTTKIDGFWRRIQDALYEYGEESKARELGLIKDGEEKAEIPEEENG